MRISDWSSDVCSSDLHRFGVHPKDVRLEGRVDDATPLGHLLTEEGKHVAIDLADCRIPDEAVGALPEAIGCDVIQPGIHRDSLRRRPLGMQLGKAVFETRSEEHTSKLQSLMRISYAVFCLQKKIKNTHNNIYYDNKNLKKTYTL